MAAQMLKSTRLAFKVCTDECNQHSDAAKSTKTRLAAALMESLELLDKKSKKLADARDEVIGVIISCKGCLDQRG